MEQEWDMEQEWNTEQECNLEQGSNRMVRMSNRGVFVGPQISSPCRFQ